MGETILYYDCFAGISGDMHLAAMVDLGVPEAYLREAAFPAWASRIHLRFTRDSRKGITGTRADVDVATEHEGHSHGHRAFADIRSLVNRSGLSEPIKARSLAIFQRLAEAEATVHGTSVEEVRFHEVGAVDSIVDIVAAALCLEYLKPDHVYASTVELGGGFVKSQHGLLPVPAPATALLLTGVPVKTGAVPFEMTTPTGAAILASSVESFTDTSRFTIKKVAYGIGHRDTEIPNILRVFLAEAPERLPGRGVHPGMQYRRHEPGAAWARSGAPLFGRGFGCVLHAYHHEEVTARGDAVGALQFRSGAPAPGADSP